MKGTRIEIKRVSQKGTILLFSKQLIYLVYYDTFFCSYKRKYPKKSRPEKTTSAFFGKMP